MLFPGGHVFFAARNLTAPVKLDAAERVDSSVRVYVGGRWSVVFAFRCTSVFSSRGYCNLSRE
jgi:hypothetical protein